jgi:alginate O-acetyltransferase complex protein AlgI
MWHGVGEVFIIWGAWHGTFMVLEHAGLGNWLKKIWSPLRHLYLLLIVIIGWVLFRSDTLTYAAGFLKSMFGLNTGNAVGNTVNTYLNNLVILTLGAAVVASTPILPGIVRSKNRFIQAIQVRGWHFTSAFELSYSSLKVLSLGAVFVSSIMSMSGALNSPFIYFKF